MQLVVSNLTKRFGEKIAVDDLSFTVSEPGVFGLIGTNGAGKTTTIRTVLGIMTPDAGTATFDGKRITRETLNFGYMPEERGIYMKAKVLEQLVYFGELRGMKRSQARDAALRYMDRLGVSEYRDMQAQKLSKGNQQKIQLIVTLLNDPVLIFLDEPFSGLDPLNAELLSGLIRELVQNGKMIIMSSHQMATVEEYCKDLIILDRGKTMLSGSLREIKGAYGHTNLIVSGGEKTAALAQEHGLVLIEKRADEMEYHITGDAMANGFLSALVAAGEYPLRFEIREPSLHQIFIEKVGAAQ